MTSESLFHFVPEIGLVVAACVVLMLGVGRSAAIRSLTAPLAMLSLLVALVVSYLHGDEAVGAVLPGLYLSPLSVFTRHVALAIGVLLVMVAWVQPQPQERGEFFAMILFSIVGVLLTASAEDLITFFFAIELVSLPTYVLVATGSSDIRAQEAGFKYFFLGALSSAIMVYGFSFLYGVSGTTAMSLATVPAPGATAATLLGCFQNSLRFHGALHPYATVGLVLAFAGLAFKLAAVPFHFYVADVYQGAPSPVAGLLGFVPKLGGLIGLTKLLALTGWQGSQNLFWMLWVLGALTMTVGNTLALLQKNVKRILAYSGVAHSGYMLIGIILGPIAGAGPFGDGIAAMLFYIAVYGVMNLGAFAVLSHLTVRGRPAEELDDLAGLARTDPLSALVMAVCVLSLVGLPPFAGFFGKFYVFAGAFSLPPEHPHHHAMVILAVIGVINSAVAAAYYLRIVGACYSSETFGPIVRVSCAPLRVAMVVCAVLMPALFVRPGNVHRQARSATVGLIPPERAQDTLHARHRDNLPPVIADR